MTLRTGTAIGVSMWVIALPLVTCLTFNGHYKGYLMVPTDIPPNSTRVNLNGNHISMIEDGAFLGLSSVQELSLHSNSITHLSVGVFSPLIQCTDLDLSNNQISVIKTKTFTGLRKLKKLWMHNHKISVMEDGAFTGLDNLWALTLGYNSLTHLPAGVFSPLAQCNYLDLHNNQITHLENGTFTGLHHLWALTLGHNLITYLPTGAFRPLILCNYMELHNNQITMIEDGALTGLENLQGLSLQNNMLTNLSDGVFSSLTQCNYLNLSSNQISVIEHGAFAGLSFLQELYLHNNSIAQVNSSSVFGPLTHCEKLGLDSNQISAIASQTFTGLINLQKLYLYNNVITYLPAFGFSPLSQCKELWLNNNKVSVIEENAFVGLDSLGHLWLQNNHISVIKKNVFTGLGNFWQLWLHNNQIFIAEKNSFLELSNLQHLDLANGPLSTIEDGAFAGLNNLKSLDLTNSQVSVIEDGAFTGLGNLQTLHMFNNSITHFPAGVFSPLALCDFLNLYNNEISVIYNNTFSGLNYLQTLQMSDNNISRIELGAFIGLNNLQTLSLYNNSITHLLAGVFSSLSQCTALWLNDNKIPEIVNNAFLGLSSLQQLWLQNNQISVIENGAFSGLTRLWSLHIYGNYLGSISFHLFLDLPRPLELSLSNPQSDRSVLWQCEMLCWLKNEEATGSIEWYTEWYEWQDPIIFKPECSLGEWDNLGQSLSECEDPGPIINGVKHSRHISEFDGRYHCGDQVTYTCDHGYELNAHPVMFCESNGNFNDSKPECIPKVCEDPGPVSNGVMYPDVRPFKYGDRVTYVCREEYQTVGDQVIECRTNGEFSPSKPQCVKKYCQDPGEVAHGWKDPATGPYQQGDQVNYTCNFGYRLVGEHLSQCGADGLFSSPKPKCVPTECDDPGPMLHGMRDPAMGPYKYRDRLVYTCDIGHQIVGDAVIVCGGNGGFIPPKPQCVPTGISKKLFVECEDPGILLHGIKDPASGPFLFGDKVTYTCDAGYWLDGDQINHCGANGTFSPAKPKCFPQECDDPGEVMNGVRYPSAESILPGKAGHKYKDTLSFTCEQGYKMVGHNLIRCEENGEFYPAKPHCVAEGEMDPIFILDYRIIFAIVIIVAIILITMYCIWKRTSSGEAEKRATVPVRVAETRTVPKTTDVYWPVRGRDFEDEDDTEFMQNMGNMQRESEPPPPPYFLHRQYTTVDIAGTHGEMV